MPITLVRVDDRVIHGQIVTRWARERKCDEIIVVDDKIASDKVLSMVMKNAAPLGIKVSIYTIKDAIPMIIKAKDSQKNYFIIVKTPITLLKLIEGGCDFIKEVIYGPSSARPNTVNVAPNASLTYEEIEACEQLHNWGVDITFQLVPESKMYRWGDIREEFVKK